MRSYKVFRNLRRKPEIYGLSYDLFLFFVFGLIAVCFWVSMFLSLRNIFIALFVLIGLYLLLFYWDQLFSKLEQTKFPKLIDTRYPSLTKDFNKDGN